MTLSSSLLLALMAGLSIPLGALASSHLRLRSFCRQREIDSFVAYFGGGALLAAIALVLIPHGMKDASTLSAAWSFFLGGLIFWGINRWVKGRGGTASQFIGMLLDYIPEAIALGAASAGESNTGYLLAGLIALQNLPEGFASFHEMHAGGLSKGRLWLIFLLAPLAGPLSAWLGYAWPSNESGSLGLLMLFCSGGIIYLIFDDIAPGAHLKHRDFPALGAVSGFLLGMVGTMMVH
ncbi:ZIP family metal transporter [Methylohalobius crimeensis]|uniref:ZIP family metal transporter n=1 Tax=Methylohalobius crimeensis TaxID=244365 RepID=UPI0003B6F915|nr:zinc transporter [Methylohalobius crimeensis]